MNKSFYKIIYFIFPFFAYISYLAFKHIDFHDFAHITKDNDFILIDSKLFFNAQYASNNLIIFSLPILLIFLWLNFFYWVLL